ncbi:hypothetical protein ABH897_002775 [Paenibacillus sp. RC73]|uniref:hypothetical protein n=1 Tax=Paenibacillus sp. RC73 TaxID=3156250 RepID=UPI00383983ED
MNDEAIHQLIFNYIAIHYTVNPQGMSEKSANAVIMTENRHFPPLTTREATIFEKEYK